METVRSMKRIAFENELKQCQDLPIYDECMRNLGLRDYEIKVAVEEDKDQILESASYCYATQNPMNVLFRLTPANNMKRWENKVNKFIQTGTYLILKHKYNHQIIGGVGLLDLCEVPQKTDFDNDNVMKKIHLFYEIVKKTAQLFHENNANNPKYKVLNEIVKIREKILNNEVTTEEMKIITSTYYGKWRESGLYWIHPQFDRRGYGLFLRNIFVHISHRLNYSTVRRTHNPRTIKDRVGKARLKFVDFVFKDGRKMVDYLDELKNKWDFSQGKIDKYKQLTYHYFVDCIEDVTPILCWKEYLASVNTAILRKTISKL
eukprot:324467_1